MSEPLPNPYDWESFKRLMKVASSLLLVVVILSILYKPILLAIMSGLIISYITTPVVDRICMRSPFGRKATVGSLIAICVILISVVAILVLPFIYEETVHIIRMIPEAINYLETLLKPIASRMASSTVLPEEALGAGLRRLTALPQLFDEDGPLHQLVMQTPAVIELAFNVFMVPAFTYIFLAERERFKGLVARCVPVELHELGGTFVIRVNSLLRAVVKGQFIVAFYLSIFYMAGFAAIGVPSGVAIGALAGLCRLVPYLDAVVGLALCAVTILTQGSGLAVFLSAVGVIVAVQALDGMFITPRIIGDRSGLHPLVVIASVYAFGSQFGVVGILLAVPVVAAAVVVAKLSWPYIRQSSFFGSAD